MRFLLGIPCLTLLLFPLAEARNIYQVSSTQQLCDGPFRMKTLLKLIQSTAEEAQKELLSKCVLQNRPGHLIGQLTGLQNLEDFSVSNNAVTCVNLTVTQDCSVQ